MRINYCTGTTFVVLDNDDRATFCPDDDRPAIQYYDVKTADCVQVTLPADLLIKIAKEIIEHYSPEYGDLSAENTRLEQDLARLKVEYADMQKRFDEATDTNEGSR